MIALPDLKASASLVRDFDWPFDFVLQRANKRTRGLRLMPNLPFTVIAEDGMGGLFLAYGSGAVESLPVLHGTSEGQCGRVASNLDEWLAILLAVPYWRDLLKFSGGGQLELMRKTAIFMERDSKEELPDLPEARSRILDQLPIRRLDDPIKVLHDNVQTTDCVLVAKDGYQCRSLFGTFIPTDNPNWR